MKKIILSVILCLVFGFASAQAKDTTIIFDKLVHDFGNIAQGSGLHSCKFEFTNTGTEPIVIYQIQASCGCTASSWTKEPVAPGEKGEISATYNPGGAVPFDKTLTVLSNATPSSIVLRVKGVVVAAPKE